MYRELEEFYKKNSNQIKFRKISSWVFFLLAIPILCFGGMVGGNWLIKFIIISVILFILAVLIPISIYLLPTWQKVDGKTCRLDEQDYTLMKKYLKKKKLYTGEALRIIAEHYLIKNHNCGKANDLLTIFLAVATATASCFNSDGSWGAVRIAYIFLAILFFIAVYYTIRVYSAHFRFYTGDDDLCQNLEEIMTRLYLEATDKKKN